MEKEIWKDVKGYEGIYKVSNFGNVKSITRKVKNTRGYRISKGCDMKFTTRSGYYNVVLRNKGKRQSKQVHRMVAEAFLLNPNNLPVVNHKDFNRKNNNVENLEWCTVADNIRWSAENMKKPKHICYSSTNEKYIYKREEKFRVCIRKFGIDRTFKTIEEARAFKNGVIECEKEYFGK